MKRYPSQLFDGDHSITLRGWSTLYNLISDILKCISWAEQMLSSYTDKLYRYLWPSRLLVRNYQIQIFQPTHITTDLKKVPKINKKDAFVQAIGMIINFREKS